jgi:hypothetical protein
VGTSGKRVDDQATYSVFEQMPSVCEYPSQHPIDCPAGSRLPLMFNQLIWMVSNAVGHENVNRLKM